MTPEEAKTKWCPAVRFTGAGTGSPQHGGNYDWATNRGDDHGEQAFNCVAEECMAWRWLNKKLGHELQHHVNLHGNEDGPPAWRKFCASDPLQGYCGLAGKPE